VVIIRFPNVPTSDAVVKLSCDATVTTPSTSACRIPLSASNDNVLPEPLVAATNVQLAVGLAFVVTFPNNVGVAPLAVNAVYTVALVVSVRVLKFAGLAGANLPKITSILSNASSALSPELIPDTLPALPPYAPSVGVPIITTPPDTYDAVATVHVVACVELDTNPLGLFDILSHVLAAPDT